MHMEESQIKPTLFSNDDRQEILSDRVTALVRKGYAVESQTGYSAVMVKGKRPSHGLHLFLTVITFGIWGVLVWLPLSILKHEKRVVVAIDQDGHLSETTKRGR